MEYIYAPFNPERFATDLQFDRQSNTLNWTNGKGQEVLILQTPFGQRATDAADLIPGREGSVAEAVCVRLADVELVENDFTEIFPGIWARFVSAAAKVRMKGCPLHGEASSYTVLACDRDGSTCKIYAPQDSAMHVSFCDIPLEVHIEIERDIEVVKKLFGMREIDTGFFKVHFPASLAKGYLDGTIRLVVEGIRIPVTKQMVSNGTVYIKTEIKPEIDTCNVGLKII